MSEIKTCAKCGTSFAKRKSGHSVYCSYDCKDAARLDRLKAKRETEGVRVVGSVAPCKICFEPMTIEGRGQLYCAECRKVADKARGERWRQNNPERYAQMRSEADKRRDESPAYQEWRKNYGREYTAKKRTNPRERLDHRISQLIRGGLRNKNGRTWESLVGFSVDELYTHLERQFLPGMSWENIGDWHVDHILPRSMFSYETADCPDFKACWAITNLRPLWAEDNLKKSGTRTHLI
ncbi:hypothetical protein BTE77_06675 [Ensifer adhaerens]|nr:hypothetical protein BTE77_06675 [Ensifer adhaerens]